MGMRGGLDMKGGNFRGSGDTWGGNSGIHSIHMRGLPFKATEQDIADVGFKLIKSLNTSLPFFPLLSLSFSLSMTFYCIILVL